MQTYRTQATVSNGSVVIIKEVPFHPGEEVEVIVRVREHVDEERDRYPLRGTPVCYVDPFEGVAEDDWAVLQ